MKSLLSSNPVLWFLLVFDLAVALALGFDPVAESVGIQGVPRVAVSTVLTFVALGAGANLLRRHLSAV